MYLSSVLIISTILISGTAIILNQQFSSVDAPSALSQFSHHLSLLTSKSDNQRKESLNHITTAIATSVRNSQELPQPTKALLPKVLLLAQDANEGVRAQVLKFLQALPPQDVRENIETISRYLRLALTHLAVTIRSSAVDALGFILEIAGDELVSCLWGWVETLKCLIAVLGWDESKTGDGWTSHNPKTTNDSRVMGKYLRLLTTVLQAGLSRPSKDPEPAEIWFPGYQMDRYMIPQGSNPYGYLNLFGPATSEDEQGHDTHQERQNVFNQRFRPIVERGLVNARTEGGDVGRAAVKAHDAMSAAMNGFEAVAV